MVALASALAESGAHLSRIADIGGARDVVGVASDVGDRVQGQAAERIFRAGRAAVVARADSRHRAEG